MNAQDLSKADAWWLISKRDAAQVDDMLTAIQNELDGLIAAGWQTPLPGMVKQVKMLLDTGLHSTAHIPADWEPA